MATHEPDNKDYKIVDSIPDYLDIGIKEQMNYLRKQYPMFIDPNIYTSTEYANS